MPDLKKYLPHIAAILAFLLISAIYFSPVTFDGKRLKQSDIRQYKGMSKEIVDHRESTGEEAMWTNSMFGGMPAYQISLKHPNNLMAKVDKVLRLGLPRPLDMVFLYMLGFFILMMCLKVDPWLALVGSLAFALSSYFFVIIEAGHNSKANAVAYMAPTIGAFYLLYRRNMLVGGALFAFFMALEITMNHVQVTYYMGFILLFFGIAELISAARNGRVADMLKRSGIAVAAITLAVLCNASNLLTTKEYGDYTTRGKTELTIKADGSSNDDIRTSGLDKEYVTQWSYGKQESLTLLIPNAKGGESGYVAADEDLLNNFPRQTWQRLADERVNTYWGDQTFTSGPHYLGAIVMLLLVLAIAYSEKKMMWWMVAALPLLFLLPQISSPMVSGLLVLGYVLAGAFLQDSVLKYALFGALVMTLILSWGRNYMPFTEFFLDHIPGYNKFRAVTIILVIVEIAAPLIGILYLAELIKKTEVFDKNEMKPFLIGTGVLVLFFLLAIVSPSGILGLEFFSDAEKARYEAQMVSNADQAGSTQLFIDEIKEGRISIFRTDAIRSLIFVLLGAAVIFLFMKKKINKTVLIAVIGALVMADMLPIDKRYLNNDKLDDGNNRSKQYISWSDKSKEALPHSPTNADIDVLQKETTPVVQEGIEQALAELAERKKNAKGKDKRTTDQEKAIAAFTGLNRTTNFRVFDLSDPFKDGRTSYFHKSIGGYHGAKMKRYQELCEFYLYQARVNIGTSINMAGQAGGDFNVINTALQKEGVLNMLNTKYILYNPGAPALQNPNALGNAWAVEEVRMVKNADEEITALGEIDPLRTALVDERYADLIPADLSPDASATIEMTSYAPNRITYSSNASAENLVVFSEIFYEPDWQAYIDNEPVDHFRVNYVLRGLIVPAGEHQIEFKIEAKTYALGSMLSLVGSILIILIVLGVAFMEFKKRKPEVKE